MRYRVANSAHTTNCCSQRGSRIVILLFEGKSHRGTDGGVPANAESTTPCSNPRILLSGYIQPPSSASSLLPKEFSSLGDDLLSCNVFQHQPILSRWQQPLSTYGRLNGDAHNVYPVLQLIQSPSILQTWHETPLFKPFRRGHASRSRKVSLGFDSHSAPHEENRYVRDHTYLTSVLCRKKGN